MTMQTLSTRPADAGLEHLTATRKGRPKRTIAVAAVLVVVAAAGAGLWWSRANASTGPAYRTAVAGSHHVEETLATVAVIEPVTQATVTFPVDGTVAAVDVADGDIVGVGDALAQLATEDLQDAVDEAQASLASAQLTHRQAVDGELSGGGGAGGAPDPSADPQAAAAGTSTVSSQDLVVYQEAVEAAEANLAVAQQAVQQATIASPIDGMVVDVSLAVGDTVTAASDTQAVTIVSDDGYELTTDVDVADLTDIEVGQPVTIVPDTDPTQTVAGEVVEIAVTPTDGTTSYAVTIGVSGDYSHLRNGGLATATISLATADAEVAVPTSALTPQGADHTVTVRELDGTTSTRTVTVGAVGPAWTEITAGLDAGETVVLADLDEPLPGSATDAANGTDGGGFQGGGGFGGGSGGFTPPAGFGPPGG